MENDFIGRKDAINEIREDAGCDFCSVKMLGAVYLVALEKRLDGLSRCLLLMLLRLFIARIATTGTISIFA